MKPATPGYADVSMELEPVQKPHPPLWGGVNNPQGVVASAKAGTNVLMNAPVAPAKKIVESYMSTFRTTFGEAAPLPNVGIARMIYIGQTEKETHEIAARAYASFYESAATLYRRFQTAPLHFPPQYEAIRAAGVMVVGTAEQVRTRIAKQLQETGANFFAGRFAFGDLSLEECVYSTQAFAREVMPHCQPLTETA